MDNKKIVMEIDIVEFYENLVTKKTNILKFEVENSKKSCNLTRSKK